MGTLVLAGATSGSATLTPVDAVTAVITLPSATSTLATLGANTFVGNQAITGALSVSTTLTVTGVSTLNAAVGFNAAAGGNVISHSSGYGLQITAASAVNQLRLTRTGSATADFRNYVSGDTWNVADLSGTGGTMAFTAAGAVLFSAGSGYTFKGSGVSTSAMFSGQCANATEFQWGPDIGASSIYRVQNSAGTGVYLTSGNTAWTANSDERLKDIAGEFTGALDFIVSKVRTVRGTWKADETKRSRSFLIAQDWQEYLPEGIEVSADGILGLTKEDTIPVAFAAIKELAAMVKDLTTRLAALEAK